MASAQLGVRLGDPRTSADEADVKVTVTAGDVRERATLEDHTGELTARSPCASPTAAARPAGGGEPEPATVADLPLDMPVQCAATARRGGRDVLGVYDASTR